MQPVETLQIYFINNSTYNEIPLQIENMFPGDSETKTYQVSIVHTGSIAVYVTFEPDEGGSEVLGEVLEVDFSTTAGRTLYSGTLDGFEDYGSTFYIAENSGDRSTITFDFGLSLPTSADNNTYANQYLSGDLVFWVEQGDPEPVLTAPQTGDDGTWTVDGEAVIVLQGQDDYTLIDYLLAWRWFLCGMAVLVVLVVWFVWRRKKLKGACAYDEE